MRTKPFTVLAAAFVALAPAALASHGQLENGDLYSYPFQAQQDTYIGFDWAGVGGPGGDGTFAPHGSNNLGPTPDDCYDIDDYPGNSWRKYAFPSVSVQTTIERQTLVPGQSTTAPAELVMACSLARELVFGQETDHEYASAPQQVGFGDLEVSVLAVVSSAGFFDEALTAKPLTVTVQYCAADFAGTSSTGEESWSTFGFNNGELQVAGTPVCADLTGDYLAHLEDNPDLQWDAGTFNRIGGGNVYRQSVANDPDGLKVMCVSVEVVDANGAAAGFFEDYSWFFVDNVDANVVTDFWTDPIGRTDGGAPGLDCSSVGIAV